MTVNKIHGVDKLGELVSREKLSGKKIIHCHGVFDLIHIGHIKHLEAAKKLGDVLVVTTTPDRFVNKGPHRPAFGEQLRAEALAALSCVDFVAINEWPTAVEIIKVVKPDLFVKGFVKEDGKRDHTNAISEEEDAVNSVGGKLQCLHADQPFHQHLFPPNTFVSGKIPVCHFA
jgi:rfaE bifunctional protein nucleotidyltransferase chain/domain